MMMYRAIPNLISNEKYPKNNSVSETNEYPDRFEKCCLVFVCENSSPSFSDVTQACMYI